MMNVKDFTAHIKAVGPPDGLLEGQFTAYASVFGNVDTVGDKVIKGAFTDTLTEWTASGDPIPLLWGHETKDPFSNIGEVTAAAEDDHGLLVTAQLDTENPKAAQTYRLIKGRRTRSMSFAFDVIDGVKVAGPDGTSILELRKLKLYEVSVVPIGANDQAEILAVKAAMVRIADDLLADEKAGRTISAANEALIADMAAAAAGIVATAKNVLASIDSGKATEHQEKASGTHEPANPPPTPDGAPFPVVEPMRSPSAKNLATRKINILSLSIV